MAADPDGARLLRASLQVLKDRAGEHFGRLVGDGRVADFFRTVSVRVCERVAEWAQAGAERLRQGGKSSPWRAGDLPSSRALLRLAKVASSYSAERNGHRSVSGASSPGVPGALDVPALRRMGEALGRPMPGRPEAGRHISSAAARGRSTTTGRAPARSGDQAGHLRRVGPEQQPSRTPKRR